MTVSDRISFTRVSLLVTVLAIGLGPLYSEPEYSWVRNSVSQLGAQSTKNSAIMVVGFLALGMGLVVDTFRSRDLRRIPFGLFGLFFALAGCFPHEAWIEGRESSALIHRLHQVMANLSGLAITVGHLVAGTVASRKSAKFVSFSLAVSCVVLPLAMLKLPELMGLLQRLMYGLTFLWLWKNPGVPSRELGH